MRYFNNILNFFLPDNLAHAGLEMAYRSRLHIIFIFALAFFTFGQADVGQAGIGAVNKAKVSCNRPVPQHAVIAQPKMLLLLFNHHLNGPSTQIIADDFIRAGSEVIGNNCDKIPVTSPLREHDFHFAEIFHRSNPPSDSAAAGLAQASDGIPAARALQNVFAVSADFFAAAVNSQPAIRLANTDEMPLAGIAGLRHDRAEIKRIEQNFDVELLRNLNIQNNLSSQLGEFFERHIQLCSMFFFDVQPTADWNGNPAIPQACLENRMAHAVLAGGMMMNLSDGLHLLRPLDGLRVVDDEHATAAVFTIQPSEQTQRQIPMSSRVIKTAAPEKLAVIGPVLNVSKHADDALDGACVADADGHDEVAIIGVGVSCENRFYRPEKSVKFSRDFADSNHTASLPVNTVVHNIYRPARLYLFKHSYHKIPYYRSV